MQYKVNRVISIIIIFFLVIGLILLLNKTFLKEVYYDYTKSAITVPKYSFLIKKKENKEEETVHLELISVRNIKNIRDDIKEYLEEFVGKNDAGEYCDKRSNKRFIKYDVIEGKAFNRIVIDYEMVSDCEAGEK